MEKKKTPKRLRRMRRRVDEHRVYGKRFFQRIAYKKFLIDNSKAIKFELIIVAMGKKCKLAIMSPLVVTFSFSLNRKYDYFTLSNFD